MIENPWHRLPVRPPFVLPEDEEAVQAFNSEASESHRLRIDILLPEPFVGDPDAPVVLLGNNPGFTDEGAAVKREARFVARMRNNLLHLPCDYPLVYLAPDADGSPRRWWEKKLKGLLDRFPPQTIAASVFAVEYFPYPSRRYGFKGRWLPSQAYSFQLVRRAMERRAVIVLTRGEERWLKSVPELGGYKGLFKVTSRQAGTVSPGNCHRFDDIVRAINERESAQHRE